MALKLTLKPKERLIIGGTVVILRNGNTSSNLIIENKVPVLIREKDVMHRVRADSPCRKIYFVIQLMYVDAKNIAEYHGIYGKLVQEVLEAAPSTMRLLDEISEHIYNERFYRALKTARTLMEYEQTLMGSAQKHDEASCCPQTVESSSSQSARQ
jgi:flagellar protein FlbT